MMRETIESRVLHRPQWSAIEYRPNAESSERIIKESDLEVRRVDGALEVNTENEGIEVHSPIDCEPRSSIPVLAMTELPSDKSPLERSDSNIVGEVVSKYRIWGWLNRRGQIALVVILTLIITAIVGAVTGTLLNRKPSPPPALLSNLAAVNWTTAANVTVYVVFSQEADGSLIAHRQEGGGGWARVNISQIFRDSGVNLGIRASTPLAATAISSPTKSHDLKINELSLFYLTPSNHITQIVTHNDTLQEWDWGDIGPHSGVRLSTAHGSQLSAAWQRCRNATAGCGDGTLSLTFEDVHQNYLVANSTYNWTATVASNRLAANSSMALISMDFGGNASDYLWGFFNTNGLMGSTWQDYQNGNWWWTSLGRNVMYDVPTTTLQGFASASFRNRTCALVAALVADGMVMLKYWDPAINDWHPEAKFKPGSQTAETSGFSTIAMTANGRLYGTTVAPRNIDTPLDNLVPIGFLFLHKCGSDTMAHLRRTRISLQIAKTFQGQGYGTEAIRWSLAWAFKWADLHRVEIAAASYNDRAVGLYAKLGFTLEGRQREAVFMNGEWHDIVNFGMLQREWKAQVGQLKMDRVE